jgi:hypothetical protein
MRQHRHFNRRTGAELEARYLEGRTLTELAEEFACSAPTCSSELRRRNVEMRPTGRPCGSKPVCAVEQSTITALECFKALIFMDRCVREVESGSEITPQFFGKADLSPLRSKLPSIYKSGKSIRVELDHLRVCLDGRKLGHVQTALGIATGQEALRYMLEKLEEATYMGESGHRLILTTADGEREDITPARLTEEELDEHRRIVRYA